MSRRVSCQFSVLLIVDLGYGSAVSGNEQRSVAENRPGYRQSNSSRSELSRHTCTYQIQTIFIAQQEKEVCAAYLSRCPDVSPARRTLFGLESSNAASTLSITSFTCCGTWSRCTSYASFLEGCLGVRTLPEHAVLPFTTSRESELLWRRCVAATHVRELPSARHSSFYRIPHPHSRPVFWF